MLALAPDSGLEGIELPPGYRAGATAVVCNRRGEVLLCRRRTPAAASQRWQFPQGGINPDETPRQALLRELGEETGLAADEVEIAAWLDRWLNYDLPPELRASSPRNLKGQYQAWFLLFAADRVKVDLARASDREFDAFKWAPPAAAIEQIIAFKRASYEQALGHFAAAAMGAFESWRQLPAGGCSAF